MIPLAHSQMTTFALTFDILSAGIVLGIPVPIWWRFAFPVPVLAGFEFCGDFVAARKDFRFGLGENIENGSSILPT